MPGQVVMTIIVAFILEAFVFRMNYNRKNQDSEGLCKPLGRERVRPAARLAGRLSSRQLLGCLAAQLSVRLICLALSLSLFFKYLMTETCRRSHV